MRRIVFLILLLSMAIPAAAAEAAVRIKPGELGVKQIGKFRPDRNASLAAARKAFGEPSSQRTPDDNVCNVKWDELGLKIVFANFGGGAACELGSAQTFVADGERFATWRGLRVRGSARAVRKRHPEAERHRTSFWLKSAVSPFGDGSRYPVLEAKFEQERVTAFKGFIGAAGE